jgi:hypothetical protein
MGYTIAYIGNILIATVPDDADIKAAVEAESKKVGGEDPIKFEDCEIERGLTLTHDADDGEVIFASPGGECGCIGDVDGNLYDYAVRAHAP